MFAASKCVKDHLLSATMEAEDRSNFIFYAETVRFFPVLHHPYFLSEVSGNFCTPWTYYILFIAFYFSNQYCSSCCILLCRHMQNYNDDTINDERHSLLEGYTPLTLFERVRKGLLKVLLWGEWVGDRTELQYVDSHSYHIYPTPPLGQDMIQGQLLSGVMAISVVSFSFSRVVQPEDWGPSPLGAVLSTASCPQRVWSPKTHWLPVFPELYDSSIAHSISPHNWPSGCVTSAVFWMACLIVIE